MATPVGPSSSQPPPAAADAAAGAAGASSGQGFHEFLGMQFTPDQWQQFMRTYTQMISTEIKHNEETWKRQNQINREMWSGG